MTDVTPGAAPAVAPEFQGDGVTIEPTSAALVDLRERVRRLAVLNVAKQRVTQAERDERDALARSLRSGETLQATNPQNPNQVIGKVTKAKPTTRATVSSRPDVEAWITERYPEKLVTGTRLDEERLPELIGFLGENAPWFLAEEPQVPDWAVHELVVKSTAAGQPIGWGGEIGEDAPAGLVVTEFEGAVKVTIDKNGGAELVDELWCAGVLDFAGNFAIPAGGAE